MKKTHVKNKLLRHLTVSFAILLLIPTVMGSVFFFVASRLLWRNMLLSSARHLSSGAVLMEDALSAADEFCMTLSGNEVLQKLITDAGSQNSYSLLHAANALPTLRTANSVIDRYFFYSHDQNLEFALSSRMVFQKLTVYYPSCFRYGEMDESAFWTFIRQVQGKMIYPAENTVYFNAPSRCLLAITPYQRQGSLITGHFLVYFNEEKILGLFSSIREAGAEWIGIYRSDGTLMASTRDHNLSGLMMPISQLNDMEGDRRISSDGGGYLLQYYKGPSSGWIFVALTPDSVYKSQSAPMLWIVGSGIFSFVLLALLLIFRLTRNSRKPLAQMADLLPIDLKDGSRGIWAIKESVEKVLSSNTELHDQLSARNIQLRDAAVTQLIKGNLENEEELRLLLRHTGVEIAESDEYRGIYLRLLHQNDLSEATLSRIDYRHTVLTEALSPFSPALQLLTLKNEKEYILLYTRLPDLSSLEEVAAAVYTVLRDICGTEAVMYAGISCKSLHTLSQSFASAKALALGEPEGEKYLYLAEPRPLNKTYDYTAQDEACLLAATRRNERDRITALLQDLRQRNFSQRDLSVFMRQSLFHAMIHTLSRADCPLTLPGELTNIPLQLTDDEFFHAITQQYDSMADWFLSSRHRGSQLTLDSVFRFIAENYANPDMSLTFAATHFGLTEQYLSESFKRRAGMNFSTYLEHTRIEKARELLRTSTLSVQNIAEAVGYTEIRTFRRAYSRVLGHPPNADRTGKYGSNDGPSSEAK